MGRRPTVGPQFNALELPVAPRGVDLFVDTVQGVTNAWGTSLDRAVKTVEAAVTLLDNPKRFSAEFARNATIWIIGDVREQFTAPLGLYGTRLRGGFFGMPRHSTSGGVCLDGNGASWRESATAENKPLITLREQGWEFMDLLMVPESGYSAVKLNRAEDATNPDASHAIFRNVRFAGGGTRVGYGIEDAGGAYHIGVYGCDFRNLEYAWKQTSVGIDNPTEHEWLANHFRLNKNDIYMNAEGCLFKGNWFHTPYNGSTHPITLDTKGTSDSGSATNANYVVENYFADVEAVIVDQTKGYVSATGDIWRNYATASAAFIVEAPSAA